jgi:hypothetical protein
MLGTGARINGCGSSCNFCYLSTTIDPSTLTKLSCPVCRPQPSCITSQTVAKGGWCSIFCDADNVPFRSSAFSYPPRFLFSFASPHQTRAWAAPSFVYAAAPYRLPSARLLLDMTRRVQSLIIRCGFPFCGATSSTTSCDRGETLHHRSANASETRRAPLL